MKQRSKFLTFLLSFIPGLSHFYLGYPDRGIIYLSIIGLGFVASLILGITLIRGFAIWLFIAGYLLVALIAMIDALSLTSKENTYLGRDDLIVDDEGEMKESSFINKKMITLALSVIPGAGHMYLGQQKKGLSFMSIFFFAIFFMGWLRLNFLIFLLPVIWFYVFFDAFHLVNGDETEDFDILSFLPQVSNSLIGKTLIGVGVIIIFNNIFYPLIREFLDYRVINYIQTSIVALIFIIIGVRMLKTRKEILRGEDDEN